MKIYPQANVIFSFDHKNPDGTPNRKTCPVFKWRMEGDEEFETITPTQTGDGRFEVALLAPRTGLLLYRWEQQEGQIVVGNQGGSVSEPDNCKRCGAEPETERLDDGHLGVRCPSFALMFLLGYDAMTDEQTIDAWNRMNAEYGISWSC